MVYPWDGWSAIFSVLLLFYLENFVHNTMDGAYLIKPQSYLITPPPQNNPEQPVGISKRVMFVSWLSGMVTVEAKCEDLDEI